MDLIINCLSDMFKSDDIFVPLAASQDDFKRLSCIDYMNYWSRVKS